MGTFTAVIHKEENLYVAECPEVGTTSQGETIENAIQNLQEATELYLEEFPIKPTARPILTRNERDSSLSKNNYSSSAYPLFFYS